MPHSIIIATDGAFKNGTYHTARSRGVDAGQAGSRVHTGGGQKQQGPAEEAHSTTADKVSVGTEGEGKCGISLSPLKIPQYMASCMWLSVLLHVDRLLSMDL